MEKISKTVIVGADPKNPEVLFVKTFFKDAAVRGDQRTDGSVDVLVGNKYGGFNKSAKTTYAVKTKTVCLASQPPSSTPPLPGDPARAGRERKLRLDAPAERPTRW